MQFGKSKSYSKRQDFIMICEGVMKNDYSLYETFLEE